MTSGGLYIHIPFCKSKCIYCDFYSVPSESCFDAVVDGLINEWEVRKRELETAPHTIYIGGGTPSVLPGRLVEKLFHVLPVDTAREITFEANPDDITPDYIKLLVDNGVNRLSLGVQSLNDDLLRWMRRRHDSACALQAIDTARQNGITNISGDLIYGLPEMTDQQWNSSLNRLIATGISHLSAYCLTYADGTPLAVALERGDVAETDDNTIGSQFELLRDITARAGFEHYEISNFALPGSRALHNSAYWRPDSQWLGIGPAAHSFIAHKRRANPSDIETWLKQGGQAPSSEEESQLDLLNDFIVAALRTSEGIDINDIPQRYRERLMAAAAPHIASGQMFLKDNHVGVNPRYWLISNIFMRDMILE
ncbi:MAG: radical SAM family heme chaperone HemW [Muribaculaceae bacterium]|nr:radical SAM family heme chaperone HemW [Muribaculaceae bacterium]